MGFKVEVDDRGASSAEILEAGRVMVDESLCWVMDLEAEVEVEVAGGGGGLDDDDEDEAGGGGCGVDGCESASESESSSQPMVSSGERAAPGEDRYRLAGGILMEEESGRANSMPLSISRLRCSSVSMTIRRK